MLADSNNTYGSVTKWFHWVIALAIIAMLILGFTLGFVNGSTFKAVMFVHKSLGVTILALMVMRLIWRCCNQKPAYPSSMTTFEKIMAHGMVWLLYVLIFSMLAAGLLTVAYHGMGVSVWNWFTIHFPMAANKSLSHFFSNTHSFLAWVILVCIGLHIAAALYHHFIRKDNIVKRMTSG